MTKKKEPDPNLVHLLDFLSRNMADLLIWSAIIISIFVSCLGR